MIHLRRWLVVPTAPRSAPVGRYDRALVAPEENDLGIIRIDPNVLIIIATGCAAKTSPRLAAIGRLPTDCAGGIDHFRILRIEPRD